MKQISQRFEDLRSSKLKRDYETGASLVEVMVFILLLSIVAVMVTSIIVTTFNSSNRFSNSSTTQTQVNQAASVIQRDVALATTILKATPTMLEFKARQDSQDFQIAIFSYVPGVTTDLPDGTKTDDLPDYPAVIELRRPIIGGTPTGGSQQIIVAGIASADDGYPNGGFGFRYFNAANSELTLDASSTTSQVSSVARIEYKIDAVAEGRASKIQIRSSATPSYSLPPGVQAGDLVSALPECPANFNAYIAPRTRSADLSWNAPAGATSYTIYRYNMSDGGALEETFVIPNPNTTSYTDASGLEWGTTYRYAIQAAGPGGVTGQCSASTSTVVPSTPAFVNINPLQQSLTATKSGSGAETLNGPTITNAPARSEATQNVSAGNRYTVARNLTNQLAWNNMFGATHYNVYLQGQSTPIATISSGTLYWQDTTASRVNYGATNTYVIRAANAGGESSASASITLVSPPAASTFRQPNYSAAVGADPVRPDTSTRSTTTDNVITVTSRGANTTGYRVEAYNNNTAATTNCANVSSTPALNFTGNTRTDPNAVWGSFSCYRMTPFNDAGNGPSTNLTIKQYPGKFNLVSATSTTYQWIDIARPLPPGAQCWVTSTGRGGVAPCNEAYARSSSNRYAVGLFGSVNNQRTDINVVWSQSANAFGNYTVARNRTDTSSSNVDQYGTASATAAYVAGNQSLLFKNEMPGSGYLFTVTARASNGEERALGNQRVVSAPDVARQMDRYYQSSNLPGKQRFRITAVTGTYRGLSTTTTIFTESPAGPNSGSFASNGTLQQVASLPYDGGYNAQYVTNTLTLHGITVTGATVGRSGTSNAGCQGPCTNVWQDIPEVYPRYYAGSHGMYYAGGSAANGQVVPGNTAGIPMPSGPVPPADGGSDANIVECNTISEDHDLFIEEYGCNYGEGIPPAPTNLRITNTTNGNQYTVAWNAVAHVTRYNVAVSQGGSTSVTEVTGTTRTITVPVGSSATVVVRAINNAAESPNSNTITLAGNLPTPTGVTASGVTSGNATITWNAVAGATSYQVQTTTNGVTNTNTVTTPNASISLTPGYTTTVRIRAISATAQSAFSSALSVAPTP